MKRLAIACVTMLVCAGMVSAVPTFTPAIDGTQDAGWGVTPDHSTTTQRQPTEFNLDGGMYVTDDNTNLYFGIPTDNDPWADGKSIHMFILIDVGSTAAGGNVAPWGMGGCAYDMPFLPDYQINTQWNTDNQAIGESYHLVWSGSWVQTGQVFTDGGGGGAFTEIAVSKPLLGISTAGTVLNLSVILRPAWDTNGPCACLPADEDFPSDWGGSTGTFSTQFAYTVQVDFGEADPPGIDHVHQIDRDELEIVFDEPMNEATLSDVNNYTPTGWSINSISYATATTVGLKCNFNFVEGTGYTIQVDPEVTDVAGNAMDPADDEATWTAVDYATVVFVVSAPAVYTCINLKGSFNFYHEYDSFWGGGSQQMYDDGTNGDTVSGDGRHTIVWPLVPRIEGPYEWGAETCAAQWLIQGPNPQINVTDGTQFYAYYEVPDVTTAPCDVTFRCDMQFVDDPFTGVHLAGAAPGWNYPGLDLSDADLDEQWTIVYTLPAGSPRHQEFKFQYSDGDPDQEWEFIGNRSYDIVGAPATLDLGNMFFNDILDPPYNLTSIGLAGGTARLQWNDDYQRVNFEIFEHTAPDSILENGGSIAVTPNTSYDVPASANHFHQVRTVSP